MEESHYNRPGASHSSLKIGFLPEIEAHEKMKSVELIISSKEFLWLVPAREGLEGSILRSIATLGPRAGPRYVFALLIYMK